MSVIECLSPTSLTKPSSAVRIIREYISNEIKTIETFLVNDCIGPSPFHADLYLNMEDYDSTQDGTYFEVQHKKKSTYDELFFKCSKHNFESEDDALMTLIDELESEIAFFYNFEVTEVRKIYQWGIINSEMHSLLDFEDKESKKTIIDKYFKRPKLFKPEFNLPVQHLEI